jgi:hypothetical protein
MCEFGLLLQRRDRYEQLRKDIPRCKITYDLGVNVIDLKINEIVI